MAVLVCAHLPLRHVLVLLQAIKQGEQAAKLGVGDPKLFAQQRTMAEKNVKVGLRAGLVVRGLIIRAAVHQAASWLGLADHASRAIAPSN